MAWGIMLMFAGFAHICVKGYLDSQWGHATASIVSFGKEPVTGRYGEPHLRRMAKLDFVVAAAHHVATIDAEYALRDAEPGQHVEILYNPSDAQEIVLSSGGDWWWPGIVAIVLGLLLFNPQGHAARLEAFCDRIDRLLRRRPPQAGRARRRTVEHPGRPRK
jgi:hypothetical protein